MIVQKICKNRFLFLFLFAFGIRLLVILLIHEPGYMDTSYYAVQGIQFAEGAGAQEPYIWNYLSVSETIPGPAFHYWMPMPALLAAPFWVIGRSFEVMQIPFALLSVLLIVLGAHLAWTIARNERHFWTAGLLLTFCGTVTPFLTLPETFAPFAFFGAICLWLSGRYWQTTKVYLIVAAVIASVLAYLTRSDGLLLVMLVLVLPLLRHKVMAFLVVITTVAVSLAPWCVYNLQNHHYLLPTSGTKTLWLTTYDDLYCYQCDLSIHTYWQWGWTAILHSKLKAAVNNIMILIFNLGFISFTPLAIVGGWQIRKRPEFVVAWSYLLLLFLTMTLAFTFPSSRGSLMHSLAALLPFAVVAIVVGLDVVVVWASKKRGWNTQQAQIVFSVGALVVAVVITVNALKDNLLIWKDANLLYHQAGQWLDDHAQTSCPVLVSDPPSFWYITRVPALVVPNENPATLRQVAQRYDACWLLLDPNRPYPLQDLYDSGQADGWRLVHSWTHGKLFRFIAGESTTGL
ncbi:MAG: hypothetical protein R3C14_24715 [Caldilineaceae bacterium]